VLWDWSDAELRFLKDFTTSHGGEPQDCATVTFTKSGVLDY
jgi:hypothetical protein